MVTKGSRDLARFYYFAYGSCMCPVDLRRSLAEKTHSYVIGPAQLNNYRLGFFRYSRRRQCGVLDIIPVPDAVVHGVLYALPMHLSALLDRREEGYIRQPVTGQCQGKRFTNTRTYTVLDKLGRERAPSDWYFDVVMRGAITCGLPEAYCWQLFNHMYNLQQQQSIWLRDTQSSVVYE